MAKPLSLDFFRINADDISNFHGKIEYVHTQKNQSGTAYPSDEGVSLLLYIPRTVAGVSVSVNFYDESGNTLIYEGKATLADANANYDFFKLTVSPHEIKKGLYFFEAVIQSFVPLIGKKQGSSLVFSVGGTRGERFQLTVFENTYPAPENSYGGIIYHIFVDRFNRGGKVPVRDDAVMVEDWSEDIPEFPAYPGAFLKNNTFYGGTLYGVINKLDYLKSLGVNTIYLSPVFEAYSNHKYDTGDYNVTDAMFGGEKALKSLIYEAKKRDISIILDGVFNHTGSDSVYFNRNGRYSEVGAYQSKSSPYYEWYDFQRHPDKYTCWWGIEILPRIHSNKKSCSEFFIGENGVIDKYAKMGVGGFRLDVADELSDSFISGIKSVLARNSENSLLYGEVWEDASNKIAYDVRKKYYLGGELDGVMNYPLRSGIIDYIVNKGTEKLEYALTDVFSNMPKRVRDATMNLLGTHDTERILTVLSGTSAEGYTNAQLKEKRLSDGEYEVAARRLKAAYTVVATLPGIPAIYYADEAGMEGYSDPFNRRPYPWGREDEQLLSHYKRVGKIRTESEAYRQGEFKILMLNEKALIFERINGNERFVTAFNNSREALSVSFDRNVTELLSGIVGKVFSVNSESAVIFKAENKNMLTLQ